MFGYCEFTNDNNYEQDQVNLQYTLFITKTYFEHNRIKQVINENVKKNAVNDSKVVNRIFALAGAEVTSYCGDKEEFVGRYHSYANPVAVEKGACNNKLNYNLNACGALETKLTLKPGETKEFAFILGMKSDDEADEIMERLKMGKSTYYYQWKRIRDRWKQYNAD